MLELVDYYNGLPNQRLKLTPQLLALCNSSVVNLQLRIR